MNQHPVHMGIMPHAWLQHHVPWLALFALVMTWFEDDEIAAGPDDLNG